jgi:predicted peroxiredoxin
MFGKMILITLLLLGSMLRAEDKNLVASKENNNSKVSIKKKTLSGKKLVVFVSNGDLQVAGMGFGIALSAVKQGADVTIVIGANALKYAFKEGDQNIYFAKDRTPRSLLESALKSGAQIQLCSANINEMGLDEDDFIEGVKMVISTEIFAKVYEEGARVISF